MTFKGGAFKGSQIKLKQMQKKTNNNKKNKTLCPSTSILDINVHSPTGYANLMQFL